MKTNSDYRIPVNRPNAKDVPELERREKFIINDPPQESVKKLAELIGWDKVRELAEPAPVESTAHLVKKGRL